MASSLQGGYKITIKISADVVVCSSGAIHTPALLLRSGIAGGGKVGANLRLHPVTAAFGRFPRSDPRKPSVDMMQGGMMTSYTTHLAGNWGQEAKAGSGEATSYGPLVFTPMVSFACTWRIGDTTAK